MIINIPKPGRVFIALFYTIFMALETLNQYLSNNLLASVVLGGLVLYLAYKLFEQCVS